MDGWIRMCLRKARRIGLYSMGFRLNPQFSIPLATKGNSPVSSCPRACVRPPLPVLLLHFLLPNPVAGFSFAFLWMPSSSSHLCCIQSSTYTPFLQIHPPTASTDQRSYPHPMGDEVRMPEGVCLVRVLHPSQVLGPTDRRLRWRCCAQERHVPCVWELQGDVQCMHRVHSRWKSSLDR